MGKTNDHSFLLKAPEFLPIDVEELKKFHASNPEGFNAVMCAYMQHFETRLRSDVDEFLKKSEHQDEVLSLLKAINIEVANDAAVKFPHQYLGTYTFGDLEFRLSVYLEGERLNAALESEFLKHFGEVTDDTSRVFFLRSEYGTDWKKHCQLNSTTSGSDPRPYWKWLVKDVKPETLLQFLGIQENDIDVSANRKSTRDHVSYETQSDLWMLFTELSYGRPLNLHTHSTKDELRNCDEALHAWIAFTASGKNCGKIDHRQKFVENTFQIIGKRYDSAFDVGSLNLEEIKRYLVKWIAYGMDNYSEGKIPSECHAVAKEQVAELIVRAKELLSEEEFLRSLESGTSLDTVYTMFRKVCILLLIHEYKNKSGVYLLKTKRSSADQILPNDIQMWAIKHHLGDDQKSMNILIDCININWAGKIDSDSMRFSAEDCPEDYNKEAITEVIKVAFTKNLECNKLHHLDKVKDDLFGLLREEFP